MSYEGEPEIYDNDCPVCDGAGGWDEGMGPDPVPVRCPSCNGSGDAQHPLEDADPEPADDTYQIPQYWHPEPRDAR